MKKIIAAILFTVICIATCSCSTSDISGGSASQATFTPKAEQATATSSQSNVEIISYYVGLYAATAVYQDKFNSMKYFLIGDESIVELITVEGISQTKIIKKADVERIENNSFNDFNEIAVYDKTNQCISLMITSKSAAEIMKMINSDE